MRLLGARGLRGGRTRLLRRLRSAAGAARRLLARLGRLCRLRGGRRIRRLVRLRGWLGRFRLVRLFGRLRRLRGLREGHVVRCAAAAAALLSVRLQDLRLLRQRIGRAHPSARKHDSHRTGQKRKDQHGRADPAPDCFPSHGTTPRKKDTATIVAASAFAHNNMPRFPHHAGRASPSRSSDSRLDGRARLLRVPQ